MLSTNGWRMSFTRSSAFASCSALAESPSQRFRLPNTNLMALRMPPGASHFHTSPNPPLPSGSISR